MRKMFYRILCICMILAMLVPAALATMMQEITIGGITYQYALDENGGSAYISRVDGDTCGESLDIPGKIMVSEAGMSVEVPVKGIDADAFEDCDYLKYVRMGFDRPAKIASLADGSLDFSSAENLEVIYFNWEITQENEDEIRAKSHFPGNNYVQILQYIDLAGMTIDGLNGEYSNGKVTLSFEDIIGAYSGEYTVLRYEAGKNEAEEEFNSADSSTSNFDIDDGKAVFKDAAASLRPGKTYRYVVCAWNPFSRTPYAEVEISIPNPDSPLPPAADPEPLPETGDGASLLLWFGMMAAGAIALAYSRKRKYN